MKKRILALGLALAMIFQVSPISAFAVTQENKPSDTKMITSFELEEDVENQIIFVGSKETPSLPEEITANLTTTTWKEEIISSSSEENTSSENSSSENTSSENSSSENSSSENSSSENSSSENSSSENSSSENSSSENTSSENSSSENTSSENTSSENTSSENSSSENTSSENTSSENSSSKLNVNPMNLDLTNSKENKENQTVYTSTTTSETIKVLVEWILEDKTLFSTENEAEFIYTAKLVDDTYILADDVKMPTITVNVINAEINPMMAMAPFSLTPYDHYGKVRVNDIDLVASNQDNIAEGVSYDPATGTLTVNNATINRLQTSDAKNLTIKFIGTSTINYTTPTNGAGAGLDLYDGSQVNLTSDGSAVLIVNSANDNTNAVMLGEVRDAGDGITISGNLSITANGGYGYNGVYTEELDITVKDNAKLIANGGDSNGGTANGGGIHMSYNFGHPTLTVMNNAQVIATAGDSDITMGTNAPTGITIANLTVLDNAFVHGVGGNISGDASANQGAGIYVVNYNGEGGVITQNGGTIKAESIKNTAIVWTSYSMAKGTLEGITQKSGAKGLYGIPNVIGEGAVAKAGDNESSATAVIDPYTGFWYNAPYGKLEITQEQAIGISIFNSYGDEIAITSANAGDVDNLIPGSVKYDISSNTLTLTDARLGGINIQNKFPVTIVLVGSNQFFSGIGIIAPDDSLLTFAGDGVLWIQAGAGIKAGDIIVKDDARFTIYADSGNGIQANNLTLLNDVYVLVRTEDNDGLSEKAAIFLTGNLLLENTSGVQAHNASNTANSYGLYVGGNITLNTKDTVLHTAGTGSEALKYIGEFHMPFGGSFTAVTTNGATVIADNKKPIDTNDSNYEQALIYAGVSQWDRHISNVHQNYSANKYVNIIFPGGIPAYDIKILDTSNNELENITLEVGETYDFTYELLPNSSSDSVSITASNSDIASVKSGTTTIEGRKAGTTTLRVYTTYAEKEVTVTVTAPEASGDGTELSPRVVYNFEQLKQALEHPTYTHVEVNEYGITDTATSTINVNGEKYLYIDSAAPSAQMYLTAAGTVKTLFNIGNGDSLRTYAPLAGPEINFKTAENNAVLLNVEAGGTAHIYAWALDMIGTSSNNITNVKTNGNFTLEGGYLESNTDSGTKAVVLDIDGGITNLISYGINSLYSSTNNALELSGSGDLGITLSGNTSEYNIYGMNLPTGKTINEYVDTADAIIYEGTNSFGDYTYIGKQLSTRLRIDGWIMTHDNLSQSYSNGGSASFDIASNTLTLNSVDGSYIEIEDTLSELTIVLIGENNFTNVRTPFNFSSETGSLTLTGTGSLNLALTDTTAYPSSTIMKVYKDLIFDGVEVTATAQKGVAISGNSGNFIMKNGATVTATTDLEKENWGAIESFITYSIQENSTLKVTSTNIAKAIFNAGGSVVSIDGDATVELYSALGHALYRVPQYAEGLDLVVTSGDDKATATAVTGDLTDYNNRYYQDHYLKIEATTPVIDYKLSVSPTYGSQTVPYNYTSAQTKEYTITNTGNQILNNVRVNATGDIDAFDVNVNDLISTLNPQDALNGILADTTTFTVTPKLNLTPGTYSLQLEVTSDNLAYNPKANFTFTVKEKINEIEIFSDRLFTAYADMQTVPLYLMVDGELGNSNEVEWSVKSGDSSLPLDQRTVIEESDRMDGSHKQLSMERETPKTLVIRAQVIDDPTVYDEFYLTILDTVVEFPAIEFQNTISPQADTYRFEYDPDNNYDFMLPIIAEDAPYGKTFSHWEVEGIENSLGEKKYDVSNANRSSTILELYGANVADITAGVVRAVYVDNTLVNEVRVYPTTTTATIGANKAFSFTVFPEDTQSSEVTWSVEGANSSSTQISTGGILSVGADETATTITVKATSTFDNAKFGTSTVTLLEPVGVKVLGEVRSYNPQVKTTITLTGTGSEGEFIAEIPALPTGTGLTTQNFTISDVVSGTYNLVVAKNGHIDYTIYNVIVGSTDLDLKTDSSSNISTMTMLSGDINGNGYINFDDLNILVNSSNYNKSTTDSTVNKAADINGNGIVNFDDLNIIVNSSNYNKNVTHSEYNLN